MPKQQTDYLVQLICSLTKAEKRHFRLFVKRNQASENILFLQLFDEIDKQQDYQESLILKRLPNVKKQQLSNLKAHLYKQLLISLRMTGKQHNIDIELRERIDFARMLYNKGLYLASLEMLGRTKNKALQFEQYTLALEIIDFEKLIESQYITRSIASKAEELIEASTEIASKTSKTQTFSNLSIRLYALFLQFGYVRSEQEFIYVRDYFAEHLPAYSVDSLDFYGKVYYYQSYIWYHFISQNFTKCYRFAQKYLDLFREHPWRIETETPLYLKSLHQLLNALFNLLHYERFIEVFDELCRFPDDYGFKQVKNTEGLYRLYFFLHRIKKHYLEGSFTEGLELVHELKATIELNPHNWDDHRILIFYYQIACLYFGSGDYARAIDYLNRIINQPTPHYRADIQNFARILNLIAHFELGNEQLVEYQVKSVYRFLLKNDDLHQVQKEILLFIRKIPVITATDLREAFMDLRNRLEVIQTNPYEQRPFLYLDIISWLESKIEGRSVQSVIQDKFRKRQSGGFT